MLNISKQDVWMTVLFSIVIGLIPLLLMLYISNYHPTLNIFDKNKKIFGSILGHIINIIITIIIFVVFVIDVWNASNFAATKYLAETPLLFVAIVFMIPVIYACCKGIETIGRTSEILAFFVITIIVLILISLFAYSEFSNIKPILSHGFKPIIDGCIKYISFNLVPFFTLLVIPKNNIVDAKKSNKYLILGYIIGNLSMVLIYFIIISVLGVDIASLYRYPEYYIMKKVEVFGVIENVENFFAIHWLFDIFAFNIMAVYFVKEYIINLFHFQKEKAKIIGITIVGIIGIIASLYIFKNSTIAVHFMKNTYQLMIALPLLIITVLSSLIISLKKKF
jgi:spore germination protein KB